MNWDFFYNFSDGLSDCICVLRGSEPVFKNESFQNLFTGDIEKKLLGQFQKGSPDFKSFVKKDGELSQVSWSLKEINGVQFYQGVHEILDFHHEIEEDLEGFLHHLDELDDLLSAFSAMASVFMKKYGFSGVQGLSLSRQYLWPHFFVNGSEVKTLAAKDKKFREALKAELEMLPPGTCLSTKNPLIGMLCSEAMGGVSNDLSVYGFMVKASHTYCILVYSYEKYSPLKVKQVADFGSVLKAYGQCMEGFFKAKRTEARKSDFIAVLNHELRTPLNGILGYGQLLHEMLDDPELKDSAEAIVLSGKRLLQLFENLILFQELRLVGYVVRKEVFHLSHINKKLAVEFEPRAKTKGIEFDLQEVEIEEGFEGDSHLLHHLFFNLIDNAIKFTARGQIQISYSYSKQSGILSFRVKDSGAGFSAERQEEITRDFRQLDNTMTRGYEGLGLGLSIVREILTLLNGEFRVSSEIGEGTEIVVTLPLKALIE